MKGLFYLFLLLVGIILTINDNADYIVFNLVGLFLLHVSCEGLNLYNKE